MKRIKLLSLMLSLALLISALGAQGILAQSGDTPDLVAADQGPVAAPLTDAQNRVSVIVKLEGVSPDDFGAYAAKALPGSEVVHEYDAVFVGVSMLVPVSLVDAVENLSGVAAVLEDKVIQVDTDTSKENVSRAAESQGWQVKDIQEENSGYRITIVRD